jgi:hypothetical protein
MTGKKMVGGLSNLGKRTKKKLQKNYKKKPKNYRKLTKKNKFSGKLNYREVISALFAHSLMRLLWQRRRTSTQTIRWKKIHQKIQQFLDQPYQRHKVSFLNKHNKNFMSMYVMNIYLWVT